MVESAIIYYGDFDRVVSTYPFSANKDIVISNTSATGKIINRLGSDTDATSFKIFNKGSVFAFVTFIEQI